MKNIRLGDVLIEFGYITPDQLNTALAYQKEHRDLRVGQALQELGYVNERQVLEALAQRLQLTMIDIEHTNVDVTAVEKVPQELAQKYDMLPIAQSPRALTIAANDPLNYYALEDIRQLTGLEPEIVLAELEPLRRAIRYYYAEVSARKAARTANDSDMAAAQTEDLLWLAAKAGCRPQANRSYAFCADSRVLCHSASRRWRVFCFPDWQSNGCGGRIYEYPYRNQYRTDNRSFSACLRKLFPCNVSFL